MDAGRDIELLIRANHTLLAVETTEEARLEEELRRIAGRLARVLQSWTLTEGLHVSGMPGRLYDTKDPLRALANIPTLAGGGIFLLKDMHRFLSEPEVVRRLADLARSGGSSARTLVLSAPTLELPPELAPLAVRFRLPPPGAQELKRLVHAVVQDLSRFQRVRVQLDDAAYRRLIDGLKGLTLFEAERAVARAILEDSALTAEDVEAVERLKREALARGGVVEYLPPDPDAPPLGGFVRLKSWLEKRRRAFTPEARAFGLPNPRGMVLLGVQGCGKTLAARMVASLWSLPLLKLEASRLYEKFLGESEKRLEQALALAESMAPCVLLIDEIEKALAGSEASEADAGVARRILGRLLGWLQEREAPVFVVATCNRVADLPPELLRKGRFDEIFFVDLPEAQERGEILALHLERRGRDPDAFDLDAVAAATQGFSGAELDQAIVSALHAAFSRDAELDTAALLEEARATRPLSVTRREEIEALRDWARGRAVPVA